MDRPRTPDGQAADSNGARVAGSKVVTKMTKRERRGTGSILLNGTCPVCNGTRLKLEIESVGQFDARVRIGCADWRGHDAAHKHLFGCPAAPSEWRQIPDPRIGRGRKAAVIATVRAAMEALGTREPAKAPPPAPEPLQGDAEPDAATASRRARVLAMAAAMSEALEPAEPPILERPVEALTLPPQASQVVSMHNVRTIGDLTKLSASDVLRCRGVGPATLKAIVGALAAHGLGLADEAVAPC